jgi:hypothetical protein
LKRNLIRLTFVLLVASSAMVAQSTSGPQDVQAPASANKSYRHVKKLAPPLKPLSRLAFGGGIGLMGINLQAATNLNKYMNVRGTGNFFNYTVSNINTNGLNLNGKLNFATAGASVDLYPFPNHGLRISPGALFYNQNAVTANVTVAGGTKFTLNGQNYYASSSNPITGNGSLGLNSTNPAFSITTGWGNMIPRRGGHWSAPFEVGAAMTGVPNLNIALTSGQACDQSGLNCVNVATDPNVQANLAAQVAKYKSDLNPFRFYPVISFGLAYSFNLR